MSCHDVSPDRSRPAHSTGTVTVMLRTEKAGLSCGVMEYEWQLDPYGCGCGTASHHTHPGGCSVSTTLPPPRHRWLELIQPVSSVRTPGKGIKRPIASASHVTTTRCGSCGTTDSMQRCARCDVYGRQTFRSPPHVCGSKSSQLRSCVHRLAREDHQSGMGVIPHSGIRFLNKSSDRGWSSLLLPDATGAIE